MAVAAISITGALVILAVSLFLAVLVLAVKRQWYVQVGLVVVAAMCVTLFVLGVRWLVDGDPGTNVPGAVLAPVGVALLLATTVAAKLLYAGRPGKGE